MVLSGTVANAGDNSRLRMQTAASWKERNPGRIGRNPRHGPQHSESPEEMGRGDEPLTWSVNTGVAAHRRAVTAAGTRGWEAARGEVRVFPERPSLLCPENP